MPIALPIVLAAAVMIALAAPSSARADGPLGRIELDEPFPEIALPVLGEDRRATIRSFRGKKLMLHVFASW